MMTEELQMQKNDYGNFELATSFAALTDIVETVGAAKVVELIHQTADFKERHEMEIIFKRLLGWD